MYLNKSVFMSIPFRLEKKEKLRKEREKEKLKKEKEEKEKEKESEKDSKKEKKRVILISELQRRIFEDFGGGPLILDP